jgi:hypothetical protein
LGGERVADTKEAEDDEEEMVAAVAGEWPGAR